MENGAFAPKSKCFIFHNIFKYMIFQRNRNREYRNKPVGQPNPMKNVLIENAPVVAYSLEIPIWKVLIVCHRHTTGWVVTWFLLGYNVRKNGGLLSTSMF